MMDVMAPLVRWIERHERALLQLEHGFTVLIVLALGMVVYFLPYKLAYLNFYYLPILLCGYLLGSRSAALGSLLCALWVTVYVILAPRVFFIPQTSTEIFVSIVTWAGSLLLTSYVVGRLYEKARMQFQKLRASYEREHELNGVIRRMYEETEAKNRTIEQLKDRLEETLYTTMDPLVARLWVDGRLRDEKRRVTVLFSDLVNYTTYSEENEPEVVIEELNTYFGAMESIISAFHGHIDKFIGDGIMCEFGTPDSYETHPLQAVLAALKMQECLKARRFPWQMRLGIATGYTIAGLIGTRRRSFTTIGNVVNVASRLEQLAEPGGILIDEETFREIDLWVQTERKRNLIKFKRTRDFELMEQLSRLEAELKHEPKHFDKLFEAGKACFELRFATRAMEFFAQALAVHPESNEVKLAYAEAMVRRDEFEKIEIKGKRERVAVYEVIGLHSPLADPQKIPAAIAQQYGEVLQNLKPYEDTILPVEALDGSLGHATAVALLAYAVAERLKMPEPEKKKLLVAAYLHDLGQSSVPHHILTSPGDLSSAEMEEIRKHPTESVAQLTKLGLTDEELLAMVREHHEAVNGTGYPEGKRGESICLGAQIIAVVDGYNALTSWRPYRERLNPRAALNEIRKDTERGKYDPQVVAGLVALLTA